MSEIELSSGGGKEKNLVAENELLYEAVQAVEHENEELRALKQSLHDELGAASRENAELRAKIRHLICHWRETAERMETEKSATWAAVSRWSMDAANVLEKVLS